MILAIASSSKTHSKWLRDLDLEMNALKAFRLNGWTSSPAGITSTCPPNNHLESTGMIA